MKNEDSRLTIFKELKSLIKPYSKGMKTRSDSKDHYEIEGVKEVLIAGRKKKSVYFVGIIIQSTYVGLYFMPIYSHSKEFQWLSDELRKWLKGKACFHVKELNSERKKEIEKMLKKGYSLYKKEGWI